MTKTSHKQAVLEALPGTPAQIHDATGVSYQTIFRWLTELRGEGACHIQAWRRTKSGQVSARYVPGAGKDAPRPKRLTPAEYNRRAYLKSRQEVEKEARAVRRAARENAKLQSRVPNSWFGALPGAREVRS